MRTRAPSCNGALHADAPHRNDALHGVARSRNDALHTAGGPCNDALHAPQRHAPSAKPFPSAGDHRDATQGPSV